MGRSCVERVATNTLAAVAATDTILHYGPICNTLVELNVRLVVVP